MPRKLEIVVPPAHTDRLLGALAQAEGLIGLRVQRGTSLHPPGDLVTIEVTNRGKHPMMRVLSAQGIGISGNTSLFSSEPESVISPASAGEIVRDTSESSWEEMEHAMNKESAMTVNALLVMAIAGCLATVGIATNALHIVIAAMVIAPGFQPIVRAALGIVARSNTWKRGLLDLARGYAALVAGAAATTAVLYAMDVAVLAGEASYLPAGTLISYWVKLNPSSVLITAAAAAAGAILIAANRSVLTAGVMIGLALVPAAAIVGIAIATAEWDLLALGLRRWLVEAGLVAAMSLLVLLWKRLRVHGRDMAL
jgi:hypothetical protein